MIQRRTPLRRTAPLRRNTKPKVVRVGNECGDTFYDSSCILPEGHKGAHDRRVWPELLPQKSTKTSVKRRKPIARTTRVRKRRKGKRARLGYEADRLWSLLVKRKGICELRDDRPHVCKGAHQAMHGIPRGYHATRWLPINGFEGCQAIHYYFTRHPEEWSALLLDLWGDETFRELWHLARSHAKQDLEAIVAKLRAEWEQSAPDEQAA